MIRDFLSLTFLLIFIGFYIIGNNSVVFAVNAPSFHFFSPAANGNKLPLPVANSTRLPCSPAANGNKLPSSPAANSNKLPSSSGVAFTNQSKLRFEPWGRGSNLTIEPTSNTTFQEFKLTGVTGNDSSGFVSQDLNYTGKKVTVSLRNVLKSSVCLNGKDTQISFTFTISGKSGHTALLTYVVGPVRTSGWLNDHLYQGITPGSEANINLEGLTPQDIYYLKKIVITVQRESRINNAEFGIKIA